MLLVVVLAVGVGALAVLAYRSTAPQPRAAAPEPVPSFTFGSRSPSPTPTAVPAPTPTPAEVAAASVPDRSAERFLSAGSGAMWRGVAGACGATEPLIERSTDGGQTWVDVTPRYRGVRQMAALEVFAPTEAEMIASVGDDCATQALRTFTQGRFWDDYPDLLAAYHYIDPGDAATVVTPDGVIPAPCADARSLRAEGGLLALVCNGSAWVWSGEIWNALPATGVIALDVAGDDVVVAYSAPDSCAGVAVTRFIGAVPSGGESVGCAEGADPATPAAVSVRDAAILWSGDTVFRL
ncbi:hypothetical protein [Microbacterium allomyrinae]|uniref:Uncharacterized protein n=1 Tax=Microbacterium allomyrinae TaxID=2830666 RepID=A0A9X1LYE1_9MICO|nr:hypothetical protein [Microbacterium allomyrinae]MCC2034066.1 hypothetical protein [Microbacterium allomyrinae]